MRAPFLGINKSSQLHWIDLAHLVLKTIACFALHCCLLLFVWWCPLDINKLQSPDCLRTQLVLVYFIFFQQLQLCQIKLGGNEILKSALGKGHDFSSSQKLRSVSIWAQSISAANMFVEGFALTTMRKTAEVA